MDSTNTGRDKKDKRDQLRQLKTNKEYVYAQIKLD